jgi:hypothetical protein
MLLTFAERALGTLPPELKSGIRRRGTLTLTIGDRAVGYLRKDFEGGYNVSFVVRLARLEPGFDGL